VIYGFADDVFESVFMGQYDGEADAKTVRYATRQPILADDETVIGYQLLFRNDVVNPLSWKESQESSRAAIEISSLLGLNVLCDNRLAFIRCTRDILLEKYLSFLPATKVVAEIGRDLLGDNSIKLACQALKNAGYKIAFDEFTVNDAREPYIEIADFLTVNIKQASYEDILQVTRKYGNQSIGLLAENVETREEFEFAQKAGFHYFKGYFFRKPEMMRARGVPSNRVTYLRLLQAVSEPQMRWGEIEDLIKKDPALYYRLLRYLNSAIFGIRGEVSSVSQALTILGENELRRWCRLAGAFELSGERPSDLVLAALVRARFGELMQKKIEYGEADLFLVGLLSLMDAVLQVPMSLVIDGLHLDADSTAMLVDNDGPLLPLYRLVWALERGEWSAVVRACDQLELREEYVAEAFSSAIGWAQSISAEA
jgi:EAL and modified HD-GYP domain-containing signal transduction protein